MITFFKETAEQLDAVIERTGARCSAVQWCKNKQPRQAWITCKRGDWMLWIAVRLGVSRQLVVMSVCDCIKRALTNNHNKQQAIRDIEQLERWANGDDVTFDELRVVANATNSLSCAAANAVAYVATAPDAADYVADTVMYAANTIAAASRTKYLAYCAKLVRARISYEDLVQAYIHNSE